MQKTAEKAKPAQGNPYYRAGQGTFMYFPTFLRSLPLPPVPSL